MIKLTKHNVETNVLEPVAEQADVSMAIDVQERGWPVTIYFNGGYVLTIDVDDLRDVLAEVLTHRAK